MNDSPDTPANKKSCCSPASNKTPRDMEALTATFANSATSTADKTSMVLTPGGDFIMGTDSTDHPFQGDGENPARKIRVNSFWIGKTVVTNREFQEFINASQYQTDADYYGWSYVFYGLLTEKQLKQTDKQSHPDVPWWLKVERANWRRPEGPGSSIKHRMDHPVIHVSWNDAFAYCSWKGCRLPTEAEWEYAAKAGADDQQWNWGNELEPGGKHRMNVWQGDFPETNTQADGFLGTAPAKHYKANDFGLYNVTGNVWEWVADWFSPDNHITHPVTESPQGPATGEEKIIKGGSFLCHDSYCNRYRLPARTKNTIDSTTSHVGFRVVVDT